MRSGCAASSGSRRGGGSGERRRADASGTGRGTAARAAPGQAHAPVGVRYAWGLSEPAGRVWQRLGTARLRRKCPRIQGRARPDVGVWVRVGHLRVCGPRRAVFRPGRVSPPEAPSGRVLFSRRAEPETQRERLRFGQLFGTSRSRGVPWDPCVGGLRPRVPRRTRHGTRKTQGSDLRKIQEDIHSVHVFANAPPSSPCGPFWPYTFIPKVFFLTFHMRLRASAFERDSRGRSDATTRLCVSRVRGRAGRASSGGRVSPACRAHDCLGVPPSHARRRRVATRPAAGRGRARGGSSRARVPSGPDPGRPAPLQSHAPSADLPARAMYGRSARGTLGLIARRCVARSAS